MAKSWKATERRMAKVFLTERTPLSGGNSKHSRSDSLSPYFFLESKSSKKHAVWSLYLKTRPIARKENKAPCLVLHLDNHPGFICCIHSDDLQDFIQACIDSGVYQDPSQKTESGESPDLLEELHSLPTTPDPVSDNPVPGRKSLRRSSGR